MSIKLRTVLWFTLMVFLLSAMVLVFVLVINGNSITPDPGERLVDIVLDNAEDVEFDNGKFDWDDLDFYKRGVSCTFYDGDGNKLRGTEIQGINADFLPLEDGMLRSFQVGDEEYFCYDSYVDMDISGFWIRGIVNSADSSGLMHIILVLTFTLLPAILLLTLCGGYLIVWGSFRPLDKILAAADSISDGGDLSARIALKRGPSEMKKLSRSFDRMFERLEKSFEAERQFTADASHELRTPVTVILAQCDRSGRKDKSPEDFKASISVIKEQTEKMSLLIQQLLGLTRLQHGTDRYKLEKLNLSEFLAACTEDFMAEDEKGISLECFIPEGIYAEFNPALVSRAVHNLLQNAYKYGKPGGHIELRLIKGEDRAEISVEDDGIGIEPENMDKIFNRFWQAEPSRNQQGGSGLGLSMVKEIAEFHGGCIKAESLPGKGSKFTLSI